MKNKLPSILLVFLSIVIFSGCAIASSQGGAMSGDDYITQIREKYKTIDLSDGVSKEEAVIIAQNYLIDKSIDKNCAINNPKVIDKKWWIPEGAWEIRFNAAQSIKKDQGLKWFSVYVDKHNGELKGSGWGPS